MSFRPEILDAARPASRTSQTVSDAPLSPTARSGRAGGGRARGQSWLGVADLV